MYRLTNWFIDNPVAANLIMALIVLAGYLAITDIRIEGFPRIPADSISITTYYPGANAQQIDESVSQKIEKAMEALPGVKKIQSTSYDSLSIVRIQKDYGWELERLLTDSKARLDSIDELPELAERPTITRDDFDFPALIVQVYGAVDEDVLQRVAKDLRAELLALPEITKIKSWGNKAVEVSIEADPLKLQYYGISLNDIAQAIQQDSLQYRIGSLKTAGGRIQLRGDIQAYQRTEFARIPLLIQADGSRILLQDVATIYDEVVDVEGQVRFQGKPAIGMEIVTSNRDNLLEVSDATRQLITSLTPHLPAGIALDIWADQSHYIQDRLNLLKNNAIQGLLLVLLLLSIFLNIKLAFWVAMGLPISIAGTLAVMNMDAFSYSLNDITTFGMIIVLGILVDDAVVVGESVFEQRQNSADAKEATKIGVHKVATATIFGVLTTIAAFYPMLLIDNPFGKLLAGFAVVVIIALCFSLFESKFLLPSHLAALKLSQHQPNNGIAYYWSRVQAFFQSGLHAVNQRYYRPLIAWCLHYRYAVLIILLSLFLAATHLLSSGLVRTIFFPDIPGSIISVKMSMDMHSPYQLTTANAHRIEKVAAHINQEFINESNGQEPPIRHVMTAVTSATDVEIYAELAPEESRTMDTLTILNHWRDQVGQLEGVRSIDFSGSEDFGGGFAIEVAAREPDVLNHAVATISQSLAAISGVADVHHNGKGSQPELFVKLKPEARHLGITTADIATHVGDAYGGLELQRIQRRGDEVKVMLRYSREKRDTINDFMQSQIQLPNGEWLPLMAVAQLESRYVPMSVSRRDGKRAILVFASIDKTVTSPAEVLTILQQQTIDSLQQQYPQLTITPVGELEQEGELRGGLVKALILTVVLIYVLLAIPLKSYWQPFVIMSVIPFGFAGAIVGHLIMGVPLSLLSFFGLLALAGILVNDSLVMMTRYNDMRSQGAGIHTALVEAGTSRFRAIFLTTVTTVAGLLPLLTESSEQAQYLIPAAVSIVFGELFGTLITLICVPIVLHIYTDIGHLCSLKQHPRSALTVAELE